MKDNSLGKTHKQKVQKLQDVSYTCFQKLDGTKQLTATLKFFFPKHTH